MNSFALVNFNKYLLVERPNIRRAEILINIVLFVVLYIIGGMTGLLHRPEYVTGNAVIFPDKEFAMEADVNNDLFQAATSDFLYHPPSDFIMLPRR